MPCRPRSPLSITASPGATRCGGDVEVGHHQADAGGIDENAVAVAAIDYLGVAGNDRHAHFAGGRRHRLDHAAERFHRQSFFEDEARGEIERLGAGHRQVVDRAIDGQLADVAAGEQERPDHEGIGRQGQSAAGDIHDRAIVGRPLRALAGEGRAEQPSIRFRIKRPRRHVQVAPSHVPRWEAGRKA